MNEHPIDNLMKNTMENLKDMIDVNTVIGDTITTSDGTSIVPISKVTFGFASGGSEFAIPCKVSEVSSLKHPFGGGSGAGVTVKPVAFLVVKNDTIRLLPVDQDNAYDRIVDSIPQVLDTVKNLFNQNKPESKNNSLTSLKDSSSKETTIKNYDESDSSSNNVN